jgi:hypothetical protein
VQSNKIYRIKKANHYVSPVGESLKLVGTTLQRLYLNEVVGLGLEPRQRGRVVESLWRRTVESGIEP